MAKTDSTNKNAAPKATAKATKPESGKEPAKSSGTKWPSKSAESSTAPESAAASAEAAPAAEVEAGPVTDNEVPHSSLQPENIETDTPSAGGEDLTGEHLEAERDKYLRLAAEYDNYRKRSAKEREMTYSDARIDSITKLLPIYDNFERALQMECADEAFYKGIEMIMAQFNELFENMGVKHIPALGEPFDPKLHNAVMMIIDPNLGENIIAEEYQKGFTLGERVIRFSTVVVAN